MPLGAGHCARRRRAGTAHRLCPPDRAASRRARRVPKRPLRGPERGVRLGAPSRPPAEGAGGEPRTRGCALATVRFTRPRAPGGNPRPRLLRANSAACWGRSRKFQLTGKLSRSYQGSGGVSWHVEGSARAATNPPQRTQEGPPPRPAGRCQGRCCGNRGLGRPRRPRARRAVREAQGVGPEETRWEAWRCESEAAAGVRLSSQEQGPPGQVSGLQRKQEPHLRTTSPRTRPARQGPGAGGTSRLPPPRELPEGPG